MRRSPRVPRPRPSCRRPGRYTPRLLPRLAPWRPLVFSGPRRLVVVAVVPLVRLEPGDELRVAQQQLDRGLLSFGHVSPPVCRSARVVVSGAPLPRLIAALATGPPGHTCAHVGRVGAAHPGSPASTEADWRHVPLARVLRQACPDGQGALRAAALADRAEPAFAPRRRDDERRRLRHRLVRAGRHAGGVQEHGACVERPEPARPRQARRVAPVHRPHPRHLGNAGAADELPSLQVREVAVGAQRRRRRLLDRQARPRARRRPGAAIR